MPQLRDYYLNSLGITQYVPREFCLPDTEKPATVAVPPGKHAPSKVAQTRPASIAAVLESVSPEQQTTAANQGEEKAPAQKPAVVKSTVQVEAQEETEEQLRFVICYWQIADTVVFSALDYGQNPPQDQHQLLTAILAAVGRLPNSLCEPELIQWPLVARGSAGMVGETEAEATKAKTMFNALLDSRAKQSGCAWVWVMGQQAREFLLSSEQQPNGIYSLSQQCQLAVTPGLDEMLLDASQKRTTWNLLRSQRESDQSMESPPNQ